jgi:flagellar motility protein MotE (MotC chaperone)
MSVALRASSLAFLFGLVTAATCSAATPEAPKSDAPPKVAPVRAAAPTPVQEKAAQQSEVQRLFCLNNAASANDARLAWQAAQLSELEARLKKRIADLEAKRAEYVEWVRKRDEAMSKAADNVVTIYARMKPDAAALQIAAMDDAMAAALLAKLNPRSASTILNEMEPGRAARLTNAMVGPTGSDKKKT